MQCVLLSFEYYIKVLNNIILQEEDVIRWLGHHPLWHWEVNRIAVNIFQMAICIFLLQKPGPTASANHKRHDWWCVLFIVHIIQNHPLPSTHSCAPRRIKYGRLSVNTLCIVMYTFFTTKNEAQEAQEQIRGEAHGPRSRRGVWCYLYSAHLAVIDG